MKSLPLTNMNICISDPKKIAQFANIFRHCKQITEVVNLNFDGDGLYMQGMDVSHACLFELKISEKWFDEFKVKTDCIIGVYCEILFRIISCLSDGQCITLSMGESKDQLCIDFTGKGTIEKSFEIPLVDVISDILTAPDIEYTADIGFESAEFAALVRQLSIFSDTLRFKLSDRGIDLIASGDHGKMTADIKEELVNEYAVEEGADISVSFGMTYMEKICSFSKLSSDMTVHCHLEFPMRVDYPLDGRSFSDSESYMRFFLAPKIDDE